MCSSDLFAKAETLSQALAFIGEFVEFPGADGVVEADWIKQDDHWVLLVYDWIDTWFIDPPVFARVHAPPGFAPSRRP